MNRLPIENLRPTDPKFWSTSLPLKTCQKLITTFSCSIDGKRVRRRNPPSPNKKRHKHIRLITIGPSHYCEKVRWALDMLDDNHHDMSCPIYYTEDAHPPVFQSLSSLQASRGQASMVPMVVYRADTESGNGKEEEEVMHDSKQIVRHFCPFLYPASQAKEIRKLEDYFGSQIGATARCYTYSLMLHPKYSISLAKLLTAQSSTIEKILWIRLLNQGLGYGMRKVMGINSKSAEESLKTIRRVFGEVSEMLQFQDGTRKKFIMDSEGEDVGFTAADLTFCAMASAVIHPPELKLFLPLEDHEYPPELMSLRDELRMTVAGQHVLEIYKNRRRNVVPKVVNNDRVPWKEVIALGAGSYGLSKL